MDCTTTCEKVLKNFTLMKITIYPGNKRQKAGCAYHRGGKNNFSTAKTLLIIIIMPLLGISLSGCAAPTSVPTPTATPELPTNTATLRINWFPATNTAEQNPSQAEAGPTPEYHPGIGSLTFSDSFDKPEMWNTSSAGTASAMVTRNQLVLSLDGHGPASISSVRSSTSVSDFYAEATADVSLCGSNDQYGMIFRAAPGANFYRFTINCNGQIRFERGDNGRTFPLQDWLPSGDATFGAPAHVRLGVWAVGNEMRLFMNDTYQFSVFDPLFHSGSIGFYIYASGKTTITASFSDLLVYSVSYTAPTLLPSPSFTVKP